MTTEVITDGAAVSQMDAEDEPVARVDEAIEVAFGDAVTLVVAAAVTFAMVEETEAVWGTVTVDVRLTISVMVARLAEVTVVGCEECKTRT